MLRCSKCDRIYQDGTQRFCTADGVRLQSDDEIIRQFERLPTGQLPRSTAPGELLSETVIMPPNDFTQSLPAKENKSAQTILPLGEPADGGKTNNDKLETNDNAFFSVPPKPKAESAQTSEAVFEFKPQRRIASSRRQPPAPPKKGFGRPSLMSAGLAAFLLIATGAGVGVYFFNFQTLDLIAASREPVAEPQQPENAISKNDTPPAENVPVIPEKSFLRGNMINFNNGRESLDGKLAEKFVGFSLSYPNNWTKNPNEGTKGAKHFIDLANRVSTGVPLEQLLVSWYDSQGTFEADRAAFPRLATKVNDIYNIPAYKQFSEGAVKLNGMDAYQVRFEAEALDKNNEKIKVWGQTLFLPVNKRDARSGLLITLLATSLAPTLEKVEDVGEKGELAQILRSLRLEE